MRSVLQPGAPIPDRIQWVYAQGSAFTFTLQAGLSLLEAVRRGFEEAGFTSGVLNMTSGALGPFSYVMPALSKTGQNAAFYSDIFQPLGITRLLVAAMTLGTRDGSPFFHCHALWREETGAVTGGHILPEGTFVAEPFTVQAFGIEGAEFVANYDSETNFTLFGPEPLPDRNERQPTNLFAIRLRPNQDFATALESFCTSQGISKAAIHGGVGSIIGARFIGGNEVDPFVTEMAMRSGEVTSHPDGRLQAELDVALVDHTGGVSEGRLSRGNNPILMTMELVLEAL